MCFMSVCILWQICVATQDLGFCNDLLRRYCNQLRHDPYFHGKLSHHMTCVDNNDFMQSPIYTVYFNGEASHSLIPNLNTEYINRNLNPKLEQNLKRNKLESDTEFNFHREVPEKYSFIPKSKTGNEKESLTENKKESNTANHKYSINFNPKLEQDVKRNEKSPCSESEIINSCKNEVKTNVAIRFSSEDFHKNNDFETAENKNNSTLETFYKSLEQFNHKLYWATFTNLVSKSSKERQENSISFVQSGLFIFMALHALSLEVDDLTRNEIKRALEYHFNDTDLTALLREVTSSLPTSSDTFKFRWITRLVLKDGIDIDRRTRAPVAAMELNVEFLGNLETSNLTTALNKMVTKDSGGALQNTFEEDELANGICAVLLSTIYVRPRWRSPPTVLNDTSMFHDGNTTKSARMIRINDVMHYADLHEWDAEAIKIEYGTPHLSLLLLVPRGNSLRSLASHVSNTSLTEVTGRMKSMRVAVKIPLYTLRMTLLLPNKLQKMGLTKLFIPKDTNATECKRFALSHAVQRIMFWSEAGRNAFKDDGIEWDETPEKEVLVNRPYLFYVRWKNVTILNGHFVL